MISENIGLLQILDPQKLGLDFDINFVLNTLPKHSSLLNIFSYSNIWLTLLRLGIYENLHFKKIVSGKYCCNTVVVSYITLYRLMSFFSETNKLILGGIAKTKKH